MSAYIVSPDTIDYIVTLAGRQRDGHMHSPFTFYIPATDDGARVRAAGLIPQDRDKLIGHVDQDYIFAILMAETGPMTRTKARRFAA